MINKTNFPWAKLKEMKKLAIFANLMDEMTFNYTTDSFKAPALNIISMLEECREVIIEINRGVILEGAFQSVIEELRSLIESDDAFSVVAENRGVGYLVDGILDKKVTRSYLLNVLDLCKLHQLQKYYVNEIKARISAIVKSDTNDSPKLEKYTRIFVSLLQNAGYSDRFICKTTNRYFFKNGGHITSPNDIDAYLDKYDFQDHPFTVWHVCSSNYEDLKTAFRHEDSDITDVFNGNQNTADFTNQHDGTKKFLYTRIVAKDAYSARQKSLDKISSITRQMLLYNHKIEYWLAEKCVVYADETNYVNVIMPPIPNIVKSPDFVYSKATAKFRQHFKQIDFSEDAWNRINKSLELHEAALKEDSIENQFINLFTALEVLIPKDIKSNKERINQIHDTLIPYLSINYYWKLCDSVTRSLFGWNSVATNNVLKQVAEGSSLQEKVAALMVLQKYDSDFKNNLPLDQLYKDLANDGFFLMILRMYRFHCIMSSHKELKDFLETHEKRIKWHIDRIYRTRNMIVHAGTSPAYIGTLVENLHSYYDILISQLFNDNMKSGYRDIEYSYTSCYLKFQAYKKYLEEQANNNIPIDEGNIVKSIFNK